MLNRRVLTSVVALAATITTQSFAQHRGTVTPIIDAEPGVFITGRIRRLASSFPNQHRVVIGGLHFVQEDSPNEIGRAIAGWLATR